MKSFLFTMLLLISFSSCEAQKRATVATVQAELNRVNGELQDLKRVVADLAKTGTRGKDTVIIASTDYSQQILKLQQSQVQTDLKIVELNKVLSEKPGPSGPINTKGLSDSLRTIFATVNSLPELDMQGFPGTGNTFINAPKSMTQTQRLALKVVPPYRVYQTDGTPGYYDLEKTGWVKK